MDEENIHRNRSRSLTGHVYQLTLLAPNIGDQLLAQAMVRSRDWSNCLCQRTL